MSTNVPPLLPQTGEARLRELRDEQADKLEAVADWFTDCKTLTLERLPTNLIAALLAGAAALRSAGSAQAPETPPCVSCGATESADGDWYRVCGKCRWASSSDEQAEKEQ